MSETLSYTYQPKKYNEFSGKTSVTIHLRTTAPIIVKSVTLHNVYSTYIVNSETREVKLGCNLSNDLLIIDDTTKSCTFSVDKEYSENASILISFSRSGTGTFALNDGIDDAITNFTAGTTGIQLANGTSSTGTQNPPHFTINYIVQSEPFYIDREKSINNGYPFFWGLPTDFGKYVILESTWLRTSDVNENYPYLKDLPIDFGRYSGGGWYYNGQKIIPYYNNVQLFTYFFPNDA